MPHSVAHCRTAAVSHCTALTPPVVCRSPCSTGHSRVSSLLEVRAPVRDRQAPRRERRLERNVMWTTMVSPPSARRTGTVRVFDVLGLSTRSSRLPKELGPCRSFLPLPLSPINTAATSEPPMSRTWDATSGRYGLLEKRIRHLESKRVKPSVSGCQGRSPNQLPVLNMWRRSRKAVNMELHAPSGNTSPGVEVGLHRLKDTGWS